MLCLNGDAGGETSDEADGVSESGRIDAMAWGPLGGCDATSMILSVVGVRGCLQQQHYLILAEDDDTKRQRMRCKRGS